MMCALRRQIEKVGDRILRPYVPLGTKRKGEGEGEHRSFNHSSLTTLQLVPAKLKQVNIVLSAKIPDHIQQVTPLISVQLLKRFILEEYLRLQSPLMLM